MFLLGMYLIHVQKKIGPSHNADHWCSFDAFRKVFYTGDGDPIFLDTIELTNEQEAKNIFIYTGLLNIRSVFCLLKKQ